MADNNFNFDFDSKKYVILLFIVCFFFFVLIIKAFDYLPDNNVIVSDIKQTATSTTNINDSENSKEQDITIDKNNSDNGDNGDNDNNATKKKKNNKQQNIILQNNEEFIEIDAPKGINQEALEPISNTAETISDSAVKNTSDDASQVIFNAKKLKADGDYTKALSEYQKIPGLTNDKELIASAYQGIAELYAISRKYGTALTYANKAYNLSPSYTREVLIAKIYYKAGDTDKAINNVNDLLKKGFN